ncbi:MAG: hypothetical protein P8X51_01875 [Maritimibacter sp.]|jgi:hypothetical protein
MIGASFRAAMRHLHWHLAGAALMRALERNRRAADALDRAVREVLRQ